MWQWFPDDTLRHYDITVNNDVYIGIFETDLEPFWIWTLFSLSDT